MGTPQHYTGNITHFRFQPRIKYKMMKVNKKRKLKKRLKEMSHSEKPNNSVLRNVEVAGILSEIHPIAAGVYNHAYFVIINQKKQPARSSESLDSDCSETNSVDGIGKE